MKIRHFQDGGAGNLLSWRALASGKTSAKIVVINYRFLIIYDDAIEDLDRVGKTDNEPQGSIQHKVPLIDAVVNTRVAEGLFKKNESTLVVSAGTTTIELPFNSTKDEYKLFKWTDAVSQAVDMTSHGNDPLTVMYRMHDLRPSFFKYREFGRSSLRQATMESNNAVNNSSATASEIQARSRRSSSFGDFREEWRDNDSDKSSREAKIHIAPRGTLRVNSL